MRNIFSKLFNKPTTKHLPYNEKLERIKVQWATQYLSGTDFIMTRLFVPKSWLHKNRLFIDLSKAKYLLTKGSKAYYSIGDIVFHLDYGCFRGKKRNYIALWIDMVEDYSVIEQGIYGKMAECTGELKNHVGDLYIFDIVENFRELENHQHIYDTLCNGSYKDYDTMLSDKKGSSPYCR